MNVEATLRHPADKRDKSRPDGAADEVIRPYDLLHGKAHRNADKIAVHEDARKILERGAANLRARSLPGRRDRGGRDNDNLLQAVFLLQVTLHTPIGDIVRILYLDADDTALLADAQHA